MSRARHLARPYFSPFARLGRLLVVVVSVVALAPSRERRRQAPLTPPTRRGRSLAEGDR
jgi:hypothetical protein